MSTPAPGQHTPTPPHTAAPDHDEAPGIERSTVADFAAAALLGALLWDSRRIHDIQGWLEPDDFARWGDRAIYQTILGMTATGRHVDPITLWPVLAAGEYHDAHVDQAGGGAGPLSGVSLHTLISMTPATPRADGDSFEGLERSEHVRYAQLVLDDSIRRQVAAAGSRIEQHARDAARHDSDNAAQNLIRVLTDVHTRLHELTNRLDEASPTRSAINPTPPNGTIHRGIGDSTERPGAGMAEPRPDTLTARVEPTAQQLNRAERTVIGACVASPDVRQLVEGRLHVQDFTAPETAATWQAITTLAQKREPVDFVLVAAALERRANLPGGAAGLRPSELAELAGRYDVVSAYKALETVLHAAIIRAMHRGRERLREAAIDRSRSSRQRLADAQQAVTDAGRAARRLTGTAPARALAALTPPAPVPARIHPAGALAATGRGPGSSPTARSQMRR